MYYFFIILSFLINISNGYAGNISYFSDNTLNKSQDDRGRYLDARNNSKKQSSVTKNHLKTSEQKNAISDYLTDSDKDSSFCERCSLLHEESRQDQNHNDVDDDLLIEYEDKKSCDFCECNYQYIECQFCDCQRYFSDTDNNDDLDELIDDDTIGRLDDLEEDPESDEFDEDENDDQITNNYSLMDDDDGVGDDDMGYSDDDGVGDDDMGYGADDGISGNDMGYSADDGVGDDDMGYSDDDGVGDDDMGYGADDGVGGDDMGYGADGMGDNGMMMGPGADSMGDNGMMMEPGADSMGDNGMMGPGADGMGGNGMMMGPGADGMGGNGMMMGPGADSGSIGGVVGDINQMNPAYDNSTTTMNGADMNNMTPNNMQLANVPNPIMTEPTAQNDSALISTNPSNNTSDQSLNKDNTPVNDIPQNSVDTAQNEAPNTESPNNTDQEESGKNTTTPEENSSDEVSTDDKNDYVADGIKSPQEKSEFSIKEKNVNKTVPVQKTQSKQPAKINISQPNDKTIIINQSSNDLTNNTQPTYSDSMNETEIGSDNISFSEIQEMPSSEDKYKYDYKLTSEDF